MCMEEGAPANESMKNNEKALKSARRRNNTEKIYCSHQPLPVLLVDALCSAPSNALTPSSLTGCLAPPFKSFVITPARLPPLELLGVWVFLTGVDPPNEDLTGLLDRSRPSPTVASIVEGRRECFAAELEVGAAKREN
jgi:hypothetical protein